MKYRIGVSVRIYTDGNYNPLELREDCETEIDTLAQAAEILVKLHEFFQAVARGGKPKP